jgi:DsbC/DsbD-like thiol-disulfide interchange protein
MNPISLKPNMNRNLLAVLLLLSSLVLTAASCSSGETERGANAPQPAPATNSNAEAAKASSLPEDVVRASASPVEVQAGKSAPAEVRLIIKEGYHINANPPSQYQIATQLTIEQADGITAGQAKYPPAITKKFSFSEQPLAVYEKEATINVALNVAAGSLKGARQLPARVRFQACDDQVCYPKRDLQVSIPVTVK